MSRRPPPPPPRASGSETRDVVEAVLRDQADRRRRREEPSSPPPGRRVAPGLLAAGLLALTAWFLLAPPAFLRPAPLPAPTPVEVEAGLRMDMWVAALHLGRAQDARRALPATLEEALEDPEDGADITYERISDRRFRLVGQRGSLVLVYESTEPLEAFRRPAMAVVDAPAGAP